jgi:hypothetical protein
MNEKEDGNFLAIIRRRYGQNHVKHYRLVDPPKPLTIINSREIPKKKKKFRMPKYRDNLGTNQVLKKSTKILNKKNRLPEFPNPPDLDKQDIKDDFLIFLF